MGLYVKFDGIDGESEDKDHKNWSDAISFSQSSGTAGGGQVGVSRNVGDAQLSDITITKVLDKAGPKLFEALANGKIIPKIQIHVTSNFVDSGRTTYLAYELTNVRLTGYTISGGDNDRPHETLALRPATEKMTYTEADSAGKKKGNVEFGWDLNKGQKA